MKICFFTLYSNVMCFICLCVNRQCICTFTERDTHTFGLRVCICDLFYIPGIYPMFCTITYIVVGRQKYLLHPKHSGILVYVLGR